MTIEECGKKIMELDGRITELQAEREAVLKEWNTLFNAENTENIKCIDEVCADVHTIYLVNGESRMNICTFSGFELEKYEVSEFYRYIDVMISIKNITEKRELELPEQQKILVYSKIAQIRQDYFKSKKKIGKQNVNG